MTTIDQRVVQMGFDNRQFESGVSQSVKSLDALKKGLQLEKSASGLTALSNAGRSLNLTPIADAVQGISNKFSTMGMIGFAVIQNLTNAALNMGKRIFASIVTEPLRAGLSEYEIQLNAIQTVLANTASKGTTLVDVNKALDELNAYSDKTIYNFGEMAKNIGTFTAAGVSLESSVAAIKGIANLAAVSGSNSQQAATAMYQLSQALAGGTVRLMDWNSVVNAGMGGEVFQNALKETARAHGVAVDSIIKKEGSFRDSLSSGWLSAQILTETLTKFTGDLTDAELEAMGYTAEQIVEIQKLGKTAQDAATKVKTFTQLQQTLKEAAQSGWAKTWRLIIGDFEEARSLWTGVNNVMSAMINKSADTRNAVLEEWANLGGRQAVLDGLKNIFGSLIKIMNAVKLAFVSIFPPTSGRTLAELSKGFSKFSEIFKRTGVAVAQVSRIFRGLFAAFDVLGIIAIKAITPILALLPKLIKPISNVINYLAKVGDKLVEFRNAVRYKGLLEKMFEDIANRVKPVIANFTLFVEKLKEIGQVILVWKQKIADFFSNLFPKNINFGGFENLADKANDRFSPFFDKFKGFGRILKALWGVMKKIAPIFISIASAIGKSIGDVINVIADSITNVEFEKVFDAINVGLMSAILLGVQKFMSKGSGVFDGLNGILGTAKGILDGVRGSLEAWQTNLQAKTLLTIAIAIGILTVSLIALSLIDSGKLMVSITAIGSLFAQLVLSMSMFDKIPGGGSKKMMLVAAELMVMSFAILILSTSVAILSKIDSDKIGQGLLAIAGLLTMLLIFTKVVSKSSGEMVKGLGGLLLLAVSLRILVGAVDKLGSMDIETMKKGLIALGVMITELGIFVKLASKASGGIGNGIGLLLLAASISILTKSLGVMGSMSWEQIGKGLATLGGALLAIAGSMRLMPKNSIVLAAGIFIVSLALKKMAEALMSMGSMSWGEVGRGLTALAGSMLVLAVGLKIMQRSIGGAIALVIVGSALEKLAPALKTMGSMSWEEIGKGLLLLAGVFVVLGLAGLILSPLTPILLALSAAMLLFGLGVNALGVGMGLFATGLIAVGMAGSQALGGITALIMGLVNLFPLVIGKIVEGIGTFIVSMVKIAPALIGAIVETLLAVVDGIVSMLPAFLDAMMKIVTGILEVLVENFPMFVQAGLELLVSLLKGIADNIKDVVVAAIDIVTNFIDGVASRLPDIIESGMNLIIAFVDGLKEGIIENMPRLMESLRELGAAMIDAIKESLGIASPSTEAVEVSKFMVLGLVDGMKKNMDKASKYAGILGSTVLSSLTNSVNDNMDINPVIRPVVDLSNVATSSNLLNGMLSGGITIPANVNMLTGSIGSGNMVGNSGQMSPTSQTTSVIFNQTNNSPRPLSSLEIYRQTRNQLSLLRGLVNG